MIDKRDLALTSFHWGTYRVEAREGEVVALHPFEDDSDPSPIGQGYGSGYPIEVLMEWMGKTVAAIEVG